MTTYYYELITYCMYSVKQWQGKIDYLPKFYPSNFQNTGIFALQNLLIYVAM